MSKKEKKKNDNLEKEFLEELTNCFEEATKHYKSTKMEDEPKFSSGCVKI